VVARGGATDATVCNNYDFYDLFPNTLDIIQGAKLLKKS